MKMFTVGVLWAICGVFAYGFTFAEFQDCFPHRAWPDRFSDRGIAAFTALMGPLGLAVVYFGGGYEHGLRYRGISEEESWEAYQHRWPGLTREDWLRR